MELETQSEFHLTEDPEYEAPVAISLSNRYKKRIKSQTDKTCPEIPIDPVNYKRRETFDVWESVEAMFQLLLLIISSRKISSQKDLADIGYKYDESTDKWSLSDTAADLIYLGKQNMNFNLPENLKLIIDLMNGKNWIRKK